MLDRHTFSGVLLSSAVMAAVWLTPSMALAQADAGAAPAPAAATPAKPDAKNVQLADDFMHYSLVNNADLAKANGQALLDANLPPQDFLAAFEAAGRGTRDPRQILLNNQKREALKEVSKALLEKLEEGYRATARDPQRIRAEIDRLDDGPRAYNNAIDRLRAAGQYSAPLFIEYLNDEKKKDLHPFVLRAMGEIGRPLLNPIIEQLRMADQSDKVSLVNVVGQIGYPQALPVLRMLAADANTSAELKKAIEQAMTAIDREGKAINVPAADLFLTLSRNYYERKPSYQPLLANEATNPVWVYDKGTNNVFAQQVPTNAWHTVMAIAAARQSLQLKSDNAGAVSMWVAATLKNDILVGGEGAGKSDHIIRAGGPIYLNPVLGMALADRDAALIVKTIEHIEPTQGQIGLLPQGANSPLVKALFYTDRTVRLKAALAFARANPMSKFEGSQRVVPVLAEAIGSTGLPVAVVVHPDQQKRNAIAEILDKGATKHIVYSGATLSQAMESARRVASIELLVVANGPEVGAIKTANDFRLSGAPVVVTGTAGQLPALKAEVNGNAAKGIEAVEDTADEATLMAAVNAARAEIAAPAIDATVATQHALAALVELNNIARNQGSVYNIEDAVPSLVEALKDKRPEIVTAVAGVLGQVKNTDAQKALAAAGLSADLAGDANTRISVILALAASAKHVGNALDAGVVNNYIKLVQNEADAGVRTAAATAIGALNLPSNQASGLILQSK